MHSRLYLDVLNNGFKLRRAVGPLFQELHGVIKVPHVFCVHLQKGCKFLQNVSYSRRRLPAKTADKTFVNRNLKKS